MYSLSTYNNNRFYEAAKLKVDPMSDKYPSLSPYNYCANNPIKLVDPNGMEWYENETGEVVWDKNVTIDNVPENCKYIGKTAEYCDNGNLYKGDENGLMTCYNQTVEVTPDKTSTPWMDQAKSQLGQKEIPGSKHNPSIIDYHSTTGGFKDDETPWCSSFLNWSFKKSNIEGTNSASALSWLDWGTDLSEPAYGSVGIIDYGKGKGHVGFIAGLSSQGNIVLLGGNQGDMVKYSSFPRSMFTGFVYPTGHSPNYSLPILDVKSINSKTR